MKKNAIRSLCFAALAFGGLTAKAQGLEGIIVEDYYTITAADASYLSGIGTYPINAGAKVYRIYVDMAPNYKLNTVNGSPLPQGGGPSPNPLDFTTTTTFWNEDGFGGEVPPQTARFDDGAAFDSYITVGTTGRSGFSVGCGTNTQQLGTLKTADTDGNLTLCSVYEGFPNAAANDGNIPGTAPALTYNLGGLVDFTALTASGSSFTVVGDAWATLPNGPGVDPTGTNRVLIAQLTTDGTLTFHINVQLQAAGGALETYVWNQAGAGEQVKNFLTYPAPPAPDCLGVLGGTALPGTACDDNNACTLNDVWSPACVCAGVLPAAYWDMATDAASANAIANTTIGNITAGNNNGTTTLITSTSVSSGYPGATGTNNAGAAAFTGALTASSTYFEFSLTPNAGTIFTLNGLSFGTRSTSTGAQAYTVRTSADGFVANVATGSIQNNSVWSLKSNTGLSVASLNGQPLTVRIYGHNGSGSPSMNTANWRIDDLTVSGCNTAAPSTTTGCSSSQSPYILPIGAGRTTTSILTVGDAIGGYPMVGLPDGMGAFDNNNGTFTLLLNHEIGNTQGVARAHGSIGAFVSKFVINKSNLCVQSGSDLINTVQLWNGTGFTAGTTAFNRFCAGDLADVSAFYNAGTGKGTQERIYLNGEEAGDEGRAFGHIATGPNTGVSYQLPYLGRFSWENAIASPATGDKTVVAGTDDTTPGQVYIYIGSKQTTGSEIEKAGLNNGKLFGVKVTGLTTEVSASFIAPNTPFTLHDLGFVQNTTGAALNTASNTAGVTNFLRPEDGAWDASNPSDFYFVTTNSFSAPSRMYKLHFTDILNPELGGTITAVLDGTEAVGQKMMDNMCIDQLGQAWIQEDPGNQAYLARIHKYDIATDAIVEVATHDASRFVTGGANFLTQDEESSGIIDMKDILGKGRYIINDQAHYNIPGALVQGGQLLELRTGDTTNVCVPPTIASITGAQTLCSTDTLELDAAFNGTPGLSYSWSGTGSFLFGSGNASALVTGADNGTYTVTVTNDCGTATGTVNVTVIPTATYYADVDGDLFGDPAVDSTACVQPTGYVANNTDDCPAVPGVIGSTCDDGNANTANDVLNASCVCAGQLIDCLGVPGGTATIGSACNDFNPCTVSDVYDANCICAGTIDNTDTDSDGTPDCADNCPFVAGQIGSACDDGNANTENDVLNASCQCVGTPVVCTQNEVTLTLTTDANSAQTSYDIVNTGTTTVVCSGGGFASNSVITASCCLPNGCYDLRVFDSAGDGIASPGGYVLRDASNKRIIDNDGNGSSFTSSSISPLGFCVPLGTGSLQAASCDVLNATPTTVLRAVLDPAVTTAYIAGHPNNANYGYQFWVSNPNGGFSRRILFTHAAPGSGWPTGTANAQKASYFRLNAMSSAPVIPQGVLLNVRVRSLVGGTYGVFGAACRLLLPIPPCQPSQLTTTADPVVSCGATGLSLTSTIYATTVTGATGYQFEFAKAGYLRRITSPTRQVALNFITSPLQNNNCYDVRVRVTTDGGITFCPFGPTCTITIGTATCGGSAMAPQAEDTNEDIAISAHLTIWPNPNDGSMVNVSLTEFSSEVAIVTMDVTDVYGKLVAIRTIPVQDGLLNSKVSFEQDLAPGLYLVNLQAGDQRFTERLVIQ